MSNTTTADQPPPPEADAAAETLSRRDRNVIYLLLAATFVVILNETIMSVALPALKADLGVDDVTVQWVATAFMLTMAVVIPVTGILLQRVKTRPMFITAMGLFSLGTLLSALAPGFTALLVGRIVQAVGTAVMVPLLMTTVMTLVPAAMRGRMMSNISLVIAVAPALGPTISGLILQSLGWRGMFWVVLPIAGIMLLVGASRIENVTETRYARIDMLSVLLSALGFGGLVYGLSQAGEGATVDVPFMLTTTAVGVIALAAFVVRQIALQRSGSPLLDLRTFRVRAFTLSLLVVMISFGALLGTAIILPIYMQEVLGFAPLLVGLAVLPGGLLMGLIAPVVGRIYDRRGPRVLVVPGVTLLAASLWGFTAVTSVSTPFPVLMGLHIALSLGLAMVMTPVMSTGLGAIPSHLYSHGSAIVATLQQVAAAAGSALFISTLAAVSAARVAAGEAPAVASAGGAQAAFLAGAVLSSLAVLVAWFIRGSSEPAPVEPVAGSTPVESEVDGRVTAGSEQD